MLGVPEHTNCRNCGTCCGEVVPISLTEKLLIEEYVKENFTKEIIERLRITQLTVKEARERINNAKLKKHMTRCQFRDEVEKKCTIYPVRPLICRMFGVIDSDFFPDAECTYGNSHKYMPPASMGGHIDFDRMPKFF